jgi:uncharacterized protein YjbI with pentapeptide repeats
MKVITKDEVQQIIFKGQPVINSSITGLDLYNENLFKGYEIKPRVIFESCSLYNLDFCGCNISSASFHGAFFYKGISIEDCEFNDIFHFNCGGYNEKPHDNGGACFAAAPFLVY